MFVSVPHNEVIHIKKKVTSQTCIAYNHTLKLLLHRMAYVALYLHGARHTERGIKKERRRRRRRRRRRKTAGVYTLLHYRTLSLKHCKCSRSDPLHWIAQRLRGLSLLLSKTPVKDPY